MNNNMPVLRCIALSKSYRDGKSRLSVLRDLNLSVAPGELLAIMGSSGSGKSSLLHCLGGLDEPTSGEIWLADKAFSQLSGKQKARMRNQQLGFVYQFHHLLAEFSALENVAMPLLIAGLAPMTAKARSAELLDQVGLSHRLNHRLGELSGGERQRVAIARALVNNPLCVLADEPTGNLDAHTANSILALLIHLNQTRNTSFILVTHDVNLANRMHRKLHLVDGALTTQDA